jgi:hypothetical protein
MAQSSAFPNISPKCRTTTIATWYRNVAPFAAVALLWIMVHRGIVIRLPRSASIATGRAPREMLPQEMLPQSEKYACKNRSDSLLFLSAKNKLRARSDFRLRDWRLRWSRRKQPRRSPGSDESRTASLCQRIASIAAISGHPSCALRLALLLRAVITRRRLHVDSRAARHEVVHVVADGFEGLVADVVLDVASIFVCGLLIHAEHSQELR